jgi:probable F420-dependent oxidoreductase
MEISIALPHTGKFASPETIAYVAEEAERRGYAAVWVLERLLRPTNPRPSPERPSPAMPESYANVYDPLETLAYVAAKTERVKLGTSIIDALFHVPAILARRFATLDRLSGGRVIAGLGQGYSPEEFAAANVPISRRGAGFEEFIEAMRAAWGPDPVRFSGRFYEIPESQINPKPMQEGGPPILIAAMRKPAVERAGRLGFGLNPLIPSWEALEAAVGAFKEAARGRPRPCDPAGGGARQHGYRRGDDGGEAPARRFARAGGPGPRAVARSSRPSSDCARWPPDPTGITRLRA